MSFFVHVPGSEERARAAAAAETHGAAVLSLADLKSVAANQADKAVVFLNYDVLDHVDLSPVLSALRPGGEVVIRSRAQSDAKTSLFLSGFVDVAEGHASQPDEQVYVAHKPKWDVGAAAAVSVPVRAGNGSEAVSNTSKTSWKLVATDTAEDDLVDEDALLDDGLLGFKPKTAALSQDDCGTGPGGRKRACKDCTCGRAEREVGDARVMTADELEASTSSCGNCYKGDAFRCSGCPFLGKPAFEPGQEKLVLKLDA